MDRHKFTVTNAYNLDETGCTTVQVPPKVVAEKGSKQVRSVTSQERGALITVGYTVRADGYVVPPMLIFPRVNFREYMIRGGPPACIGRANKSGWITEEIFADYLQHLIRHSKCSKEEPVLLIMDNHEHTVV
jgi:hypothetical protein